MTVLILRHYFYWMVPKICTNIDWTANTEAPCRKGQRHQQAWILQSFNICKKQPMTFDQCVVEQAPVHQRIQTIHRDINESTSSFSDTLFNVLFHSQTEEMIPSPSHEALPHLHENRSWWGTLLFKIHLHNLLFLTIFNFSLFVFSGSCMSVSTFSYFSCGWIMWISLGYSLSIYSLKV